VKGLTIDWYPKQKDKLTEMLKGKRETVKYKGRDVNIHIKDCIVFPQSAGLALNNPNDFSDEKTNLVIDIGGLTVDVSYYEGRKLVSYNSYQMGMIKFYSRVSNAINMEFNIEVRNQDVERFVRQGEVIINEEKRDFDFHRHYKEHV